MPFFLKKSIPLCPLVFGETTSAPSAVLSPCCSKSIISNFARLLVFLVVFIRGETQRAPQRLESVTLRDTKERETWRDFRDIWRDTELKRDVYQINKVMRMHLEILEDCYRWKEMTLEHGEICRKKGGNLSDPGGTQRREKQTGKFSVKERTLFLTLRSPASPAQAE